MKDRKNAGKIAVSIVAGVLLLLLYSIIFNFSAQDAEESGSLSLQLSKECVETLHNFIGKNWTAEFMDWLAMQFEHPIRKLAHFAEYACVGLLVYVLWTPWKRNGKKLYTLVILWVLVSAAADEVHQLYVPGRYGSVLDVLLDTCGGAFGLAVGVFVRKRLR